MDNHKKILVVDDEVAIRRVLAIKLKNHGYQVLLAVNGEQGLEMIRTEMPDVVVTDLNMPGLDGKSLCEKTNDLKRDREFLTIVLTARISPDDRRWFEQMHRTNFMQKPFSPSKLVDCIGQYFDDQQ